MISVIIPCHNQAKYLRGAMESVLVQVRGDHEIVVVNDGSTDGTSDVARSVIDENPDRAVRLIEQGQAGLSAARNTGIESCESEYILPLDADDFLNPTYLAQTIPLLEAGSADIVAAGRLNFGLTCQLVLQPEIEPNLLPVVNVLGYCSIYRKSCWEKVDGYPQNYPRMGYEDWEFWLKCAEAECRFAVVQEILWNYRVREGSMAAGALEDDEYLRARMITRNPGHYSVESIERAYKTLEETQNGNDN